MQCISIALNDGIFFFIRVVVADAAWLVIENNLLELRARARVCGVCVCGAQRYLARGQN